MFLLRCQYLLSVLVIPHHDAYMKTKWLAMSEKEQGNFDLTLKHVGYLHIVEITAFHLLLFTSTYVFAEF